MRKILSMITGGLLILGLVGCSSKTVETQNDTASNPPAVTEEKKTDTKVTYENFLKINMGAKYDEVKNILGDGKEESSSEVAGIKTNLYSWNGSGISNLTITIQNDEVKGILGEGQILSQTKIMDMEAVIYAWINKDGSNANFTFSDGKLEMKAQFNLK
ncbi:hypothetical protein [Clostridium sp. UBA4395]|uniref:hypothetical protein n=1 Tax=Clostridium sp. UBA4395 TaxID=1946360 RepID=UPI0032164181